MGSAVIVFLVSAAIATVALLTMMKIHEAQRIPQPWRDMLALSSVPILIVGLFLLVYPFMYPYVIDLGSR